MAYSSANMPIIKQEGLCDSPASRLAYSSHHENPRVLSVLSSLLEKIVAKNDRYVQAQAELQMQAPQQHHHHPQRLTVFHGLKPPAISVEKYVERIFKYANCSPSCFVVAYAYLDRFIHQQPGLPITSLNVHRLLITSVMVAAKFLEDAYYNNAYYAKVGGVNLLEMNRLELEFLFRLGFRLQVTVQVFDSYCTHLEREVQQIERGILPIINVLPNMNHISSYCGLVMGSANNIVSHHQHQHQHHQDEGHKQHFHDSIMQQNQKGVQAALAVAERCNYVAINVLESVS